MVSATERPEPITFDKSTWGDGPWQTEPDRVEFTHTGLPCLLLRNRSGAWCGYAAVAPGHPLHGVDYSQESPALAAALERLKARPFDPNADYSFARGIAMLTGEVRASADVVIDVHGGLTYADKCNGHICHVPQPGEPDDVWWFGFDCSHAGDITPAYDREFRSSANGGSYKDMAYARRQTEQLAEQLAALR